MYARSETDKSFSVGEKNFTVHPGYGNIFLKFKLLYI